MKSHSNKSTRACLLIFLTTLLLGCQSRTIGNIIPQPQTEDTVSEAQGDAGERTFWENNRRTKPPVTAGDSSTDSTGRVFWSRNDAQQAYSKDVNNQPDRLSYVPGDREEFVFLPIDDAIVVGNGKMTMVCRSRDRSACRTGISLQPFQNKRFYFVSDEPHDSEMSGWGYYEIRVENGETLYALNPKSKPKQFLQMYSIPLSAKKTADSFSPEPLIEGSDVMIVGIDSNSGISGISYRLSDGGTIRSDALKRLRALSSAFPENSAKLAELLSDFQVEHDRIENRYFVKVKPYQLRNIRDAKTSSLSAYIGYSEDQGAWLRFKIHHSHTDWLFADRFIVVSGDYRLDVTDADFERDHSGGRIWEWFDGDASSGRLNEALKAISESGEATIRLYGAQYYRDFDVPADQVAFIRTMLEAFDVMR